MGRQKFSDWVKWSERNTLRNIEFPGVYAIAQSRRNLVGESFDWQREIVYLGMSNSKGGLRSRMNQFDLSIRGKRGHGGAQRVFFKHSNYDELVPRLFVSVSHTKCDVTSKHPIDLRLMGEVARQEYLCWAEYVERYGCLPEFNDQERSPKK